MSSSTNNTNLNKVAVTSGDTQSERAEASSMPPVTPFRLPHRRRSDTVTSSTFSTTGPVNSPATRSVAGEDVQLGFPVDATGVGHSLETIEDHHNDSVSLAYSVRPVNPDNTPIHSPPASVYARPILRTAVSRLSAVGESASTSDVVDPGEQEDTRIVHASPSDTGSETVKGSQKTVSPPPERGSPTPEAQIQRPQVYEHQDWASTVLEDVDKAFARLENLALDNHKKEPGMSQMGHYKALLMQALEKDGRLNPFQATAEGVPMVTQAEHEKLKLRVSAIEDVLGALKRSSDEGKE